MDRRRFTIGMATIILGGSGFVASGAFGLDMSGSRGQGWVRLDEPDIDESDLEDVDEEDEETGEIRVQVVRTPGPGNRVGRLSVHPHPVSSDFVFEDNDGFLEGLDLGGMNVQAETQIGRLTGSGAEPSQQEVAFMIGNVGGVGQAGVDGQEVTVTMNLYGANGSEEPIQTDAIRMPWAIDRERAGDNLLNERIRLPPRSTIGVSIVVDGSAQDSNLEAIQQMGITVERVQYNS